MRKRPSIVSRIRRDFVGLTETKSGKIGLVLTVSLFTIALLAPIIAPYSPNASTGPSYAPPSLAHPLGTDDVGEDLLSILIWATRGSLLVGFAAGGLATTLGVGIGLFAGYYGGVRDEILMRMTDVLLALPLLPLLIVIAAIFGPSLSLVIGVIGLVSWPIMARVIRSQTLTLRTRPFVEASKLAGMGNLEIMFKVILPNMISLVALYGVIAAVTAVVIEAGLDFIGLGAINNLSWGVMLFFALGRNALLRGAWWWFLPPGAMIAFFGMGLILLGNGFERARKGEAWQYRKR